MIIETKSYHIECDNCEREYFFEKWDHWRDMLVRRCHESGWKVLPPVVRVEGCCSSGTVTYPDFDGMRFHCPECAAIDWIREPDRYEDLEPFLGNRGEI